MVLLSCRTQALCSREDDGVLRDETDPSQHTPVSWPHYAQTQSPLCLRAVRRSASGSEAEGTAPSRPQPGGLSIWAFARKSAIFPGAAFPLARVGTVSWLAAACGRAVVSCATKKAMSLTCFLLMMTGSAACQSPTRCDQWGLFGLLEAMWCCSWPAAEKGARRGGWWGAGWPTTAGGT